MILNLKEDVRSEITRSRTAESSVRFNTTHTTNNHAPNMHYISCLSRQELIPHIPSGRNHSISYDSSYGSELCITMATMLKPQWQSQWYTSLNLFLTCSKSSKVKSFFNLHCMAWRIEPSHFDVLQCFRRLGSTAWTHLIHDFDIVFTWYRFPQSPC